FPARFQLVGTMNLCPCGARGDPGAECSCSAQRLAAYRDKLSRALLDRFDLVIAVPRPRADELAAGPAEGSAAVAERVACARELLGVAPLRRTAAADELLTRAVDRLPLSGRGRARVARVSRTIAALAGAEEVRPEHVGEAIAYRAPQELAA
ncbi:MAG: magnesium chelatase family protein, partial [Gaiellaceae bacterium]|nr:magnesium chelatase family protein [Gaiellaceae bacterium]